MAVSLSYKTPNIHHIRNTLTAQMKDFHGLKSQVFEDWSSSQGAFPWDMSMCSHTKKMNDSIARRKAKTKIKENGSMLLTERTNTQRLT